MFIRIVATTLLVHIDLFYKNLVDYNCLVEGGTQISEVRIMEA